MKKKRDVELRQVMREEGSRGRRQPVRAVELEQIRQIKRIAALLDDPTCQMQRYVDVLVSDFGLAEEMPLFQRYMTLWHQRRGV